MKHNGYLDLLKFLFALGVIGVHSNLCNFSFRLIPSGYLGVEFFFMVSGYFVTKSALKERVVPKTGNCVVAYFTKRAWKILPYYFAALLYCFIIFCILERVSSAIEVFQLLYKGLFDLLPLQIAFLPALSLTGVQWYIGALLVVSSVLYVLVYKYQGSFVYVFGPILGTFALGSVYLQVATFSDGGNLMYNSFLSGLPIAIGNMFLGASVYGISHTLSKTAFTRFGWILLRAIRALILVGEIVLLFSESNGFNDLAFIMGMYFYLCLFFARPINLPSGLNRICVELGKVSLVVFMVHIKTGQWVNQNLLAIPETERLALYYLISIAVAYILYYATNVLTKNAKLKNIFIE